VRLWQVFGACVLFLSEAHLNWAVLSDPIEKAPNIRPQRSEVAKKFVLQ